jgi:1-acyl-sn-glycerol-3-phosphate acyltransferase
VHEDYYNKPIFKWVLIAVGAVPIRPSNSRNAMQSIVSLLNKNCVVGLFPEGEISTNGELADLKRGFEKILAESRGDVIVVPFAINDMWGTFFSKAPKAIKKEQKFVLEGIFILMLGHP